MADFCADQHAVLRRRAGCRRRSKGVVVKKFMAGALALLALSLTACGDSAETKAVKSINKTQDNYGAQIMSAAGNVTGATNADSAVTAIRAQASTLDRLAADLAATKVPDKARPQLNALVLEVRQAADLVRNFKSDPNFETDLRATQDRIKATTAALNRELGR
jgi:hypothetical protein